ncbi:MogA/MoaB family molybdenum cofactor biosynthesis protein [Segniliparus rugosus]|uniref:Molybdenum cofactor synthesis domain-containing protein n=1 Tax=Segniliparus rugosus (strain ATCC BAA-974 / DSM 45345 / CCUG 50838 / CIP 108380 / JCM 13579 / CDC 945) TaxID=679197 RepID=E5XN92_SEGRC|nr:molybdenum cofactor synthesis domain-containing protein [Segniliparus rugosus]EFV14188.1 molybdenum cofactor synthesis domain-containing protein [Segniliparus rugosus ATCC BAA-974]
MSERSKISVHPKAQASDLSATVSTVVHVSKAIGRALVVVVDDRAASGHPEDQLGALVKELLNEGGFHVDAIVVVPSDMADIRNALNTAVIGGVDLVVSVGGVGVSDRDVTPEATLELIDLQLPGIEQALRASGLSAGSIEAGISRGAAGVSGSTLVVNLAGTRPAVRDGMATLIPLAENVIHQLSVLDD